MYQDLGQLNVSSDPEFYLSGKGRNTMLDSFKKNLAYISGVWYELENSSQVVPLIKSLFPGAGICSATEEIACSKDLNPLICPFETDIVDVGIIRAEFGVAENGLVWVTDKNKIAQSLERLSQHLVILLHSDHLVKNMQEAYEEVYLNYHFGYFMLGPSFNLLKKKIKQQLIVCFC